MMRVGGDVSFGGAADEAPRVQNPHFTVTLRIEWRSNGGTCWLPTHSTEHSWRVMCVSCLLRSYALLFLKHCPITTLFQLLHTHTCFLWVCLRGVEGVGKLANCGIIFLGRLPLLSRGPHWRALAVSIPPPLPPPLQTHTHTHSGSRAKHGSAGLTDCSQCSTKSCRTCGLYTAQHPQHHATLATDGCTTYWTAAARLLQVSMLMFVQHINPYDVSQADNKLLQLLLTPKNPRVDFFFLFLFFFLLILTDQGKEVPPDQPFSRCEWLKGSVDQF